ncbi:MAG: tetratricopeptide repeat protein [Pseudomonadota bacterium]
MQLDGESGQALNNYGVFLCKAGEVEEGVDHLVRAVRDPFYATPAAALTNAGVCWEGDGDVEQAELFYRQSLEVDPAFGDALFLMARLLLAKGDAFRARAFLQRYESAAAPLPESLELGIEIERALDNQEGIQQYEDRLKRLFPDAGRRPSSQNSE